MNLRRIINNEIRKIIKESYDSDDYYELRNGLIISIFNDFIKRSVKPTHQNVGGM